MDRLMGKKSPQQEEAEAKEFFRTRMQNIFTAKYAVQGQGPDARLIPKKQGEDPVRAAEYAAKLKAEVEGLQQRVSQLSEDARQSPAVLELEQKKILLEIVDKIVRG